MRRRVYILYIMTQFLGGCSVFMQMDGLCHISAMLNIVMIYK